MDALIADGEEIKNQTENKMHEAAVTSPPKPPRNRWQLQC